MLTVTYKGRQHLLPQTKVNIITLDVDTEEEVFSGYAKATFTKCASKTYGPLWIFETPCYFYWFKNTWKVTDGDTGVGLNGKEGVVCATIEESIENFTNQVSKLGGVPQYLALRERFFEVVILHRQIETYLLTIILDL